MVIEDETERTVANGDRDASSADPGAKPAANPGAESAAESTAEPAAEPAAEPGVKSAAESTADPAAEPAAEPVGEQRPRGAPDRPQRRSEHRPERRPARRESSRQRRGRSTGRGPERTKGQAVQAAFAACVRCGYFLSDYRLMIGGKTFDARLEEMEGGWLDLGWWPEMRPLLELSFGIRFDSQTYHYKGQCPTCGRVFVYRRRDLEDVVAEADARDEAPEGAPQPSLKIQIWKRGQP